MGGAGRKRHVATGRRSETGTSVGATALPTGAWVLPTGGACVLPTGGACVLPTGRAVALPTARRHDTGWR